MDYCDTDPLAYDIEPEPEFERKEYIPPKCKYCGKGDLQWRQNRKGGWGLYTEGGSKHSCVEFKTGFVKTTTEKIK
jgi:hypothetical protein